MDKPGRAKKARRETKKAKELFNKSLVAVKKDTGEVVALHIPTALEAKEKLVVARTLNETTLEELDSNSKKVGIYKENLADVKTKLKILDDALNSKRGRKNEEV